MNPEITFLLTKPWYAPQQINEGTAQLRERKIFDYLEKRLSMENYKIVRAPFRMATIPQEAFWREFYSEIKDWSGFEKMIEDFRNLSFPPMIGFYSGPNVLQKIIEALGPTGVSENPADTIRGKFGNIYLAKWKNVAHTPKSGERERQIRILWKHRLA